MLLTSLDWNPHGHRKRENGKKKNTGRRGLEIELKKIRKNLREAKQHLKTEALWTKWIMPSKSPCELIVSVQNRCTGRRDVPSTEDESIEASIQPSSE